MSNHDRYWSRRQCSEIARKHRRAGCSVGWVVASDSPNLDRLRPQVREPPGRLHCTLRSSTSAGFTTQSAALPAMEGGVTHHVWDYRSSVRDSAAVGWDVPSWL